MSQDPNRSHADEEEPAVSATGGLPADFFDTPATPAMERSPMVVPSPERSFPPRKSGAPAATPSSVVIDRRTSFPVVFVVLASNLLFFVAGGLAGWSWTRKSAPPAATPVVAGPNPLLNEIVRSVETKASTSALSGLESDVGTLKGEVGVLTRELARLESRLDKPATAPSVAVAPDLKPLQTKVDDLATASRKLAPLPGSVQGLAERVEALDKRLDSLNAEVAGIPKQFDASLAPFRAEVASYASREKVNPADGAREVGAKLFREAKYAPAREVFLSLIQHNPDDARFWYFAALSQGMSTGDWGGETERMVRQGLEREKAGTPGRSEIDAQFAPLKREQGKDWLKSWRDRTLAR